MNEEWVKMWKVSESIGENVKEYGRSTKDLVGIRNLSKFESQCG